MGFVNRSAVINALATWVDLGVIKEGLENVFNLLERAEEGQSGVSRERDVGKIKLGSSFFFSFLFRLRIDDGTFISL